MSDDEKKSNVIRLGLDDDDDDLDDVSASLEDKIDAARAALKKKKRERDAKDLEEYAEILVENPDYFRIQLDSKPHLVGAVIIKAPKASAVDRYRQTMWRTDKDADAAKARSSRQLAADCVVWPEAERFDELVKEHGFVLDRIAKEADRLGAARKEAEGKG